MVTIWTPTHLDKQKPLYVAIADALAHDISTGVLEQESKLPPIRHLAKAMNVTNGTINRAYNLAEKRGLVASETGRGSYVRMQGLRPSIPGLLPTDSHGSGCDLTLNAPVMIDLQNHLAGALSSISKSQDLAYLLEYGQTRGPEHHRKLISRWLKKRQLAIQTGDLMITGGGQQALAIVLSTLTSAGENILVEELSYSGAKNFARLHGLNLIPVAMDKLGIQPDDLERKLVQTGARTLVCMPTLHNPTSRSMDEERRLAIVKIAKQHRLLIIEDDVYLRNQDTAELPTLQKLLPKQTFHVTGFSKILAPGLRVGAILAPAEFTSDLTNAAQTSTWMPPPLMADIVSHWIESGQADEMVSLRLKMTEQRIQLARNALTGLRSESSTAGTHLWLSLSHPWDSNSFTNELRYKGISVTPSDYFSTDPKKKFTAVRIAIGLPPTETQLQDALRVIAHTAKCHHRSSTVFGF